MEKRLFKYLPGGSLEPIDAGHLSQNQVKYSARVAQGRDTSERCLEPSMLLNHRLSERLVGLHIEVVAHIALLAKPKLNRFRLRLR
jgi:hypothetical protein